MTNLPRYIKYPLVAVLSLIVVCELAWIFLLKTSAGKSFLATQIETQLENALGGTTTIGSLEGALPNYIILRDLAIDDDNNPLTPDLASVEYLYLRWKPLSLLGGHVNIDELIVRQAQLDHFPVSDEDADDGANSRGSLNLPDIYIGNLEIDNFLFGQSIAGSSVQIDAVGSGALKNETVNLDLAVNSQDGFDNIAIVADINPQSNKFLVDGFIQSDVDGLIARLAGSDGPVHFKFEGDHDEVSVKLGVDAILGKFGAADLELKAPLGEDQFTVAGNIVLGEKFADIAELVGTIVDINIDGIREGDGVVLGINNVSSQSGALEGKISWSDNDDILKNLAADVRIKPLTDYFSQYGFLPDEVISLDIKLSDQTENEYSLFFQAESSKLKIASNNATTDLAQKFKGEAALQWKDNTNDIPLFRKSGSVKADIFFDLEEKLTVTNLIADLGVGLTAAGTLNVDIPANAINADIDFSAKPSFAEILTREIELKAPVTGTVRLEGTQDDFNVIMSSALPAAIYGENIIPASELSVNLSRLPSNPSGRILAMASEGEGIFDVAIASDDGAYDIQNLLYKAENFLLEGQAKILPNTEYIDINVSYKGDAGAQPYPGVALVGAVDIKGTIGNEPDTTLTITSNRLAINELSFTRLNALIAGDFSELSIKSTLGNVKSGPAQLLENASTDVTINLEDQSKITLNGFETILSGQGSVRALSPAVLTISDGVGIEGLSLATGDAGKIDLSGEFRPNRWLADIHVENISSLESDTAFSFDFDVDTDRTQIGTGGFEVTSLREETNQQLNILGDVNWIEDKLRISNSSKTDFAKFNFLIPARLVRSEQLAIDTQGPLSGEFQYDGAIEKLLGLLPVDLPAIEGDLDAKFIVGGTVTDPTINGEALLSDGAFTDDTTGFSLIGLNTSVKAQSAGSTTRIAFAGGGRGSKQEGEDRVRVDGEVELGEASKVAMEVVLTGLDISAEPVENLISNGAIEIAGPLDAINISGTVDIDEMNVAIITPPQTGLVDINVIEVNALDEEAVQPVSATNSTSAMAFDLQINADDRIYIRGRGLESEWETALRVVSSDGEATVLGTADLKRGAFDFSGRRFDLTEGKVEFDRLSPNDPVISLMASYETSDGTIAIVSASGRGSNPEVELTSTPTLPSSDVMALILFGKPSEDLTAIESLQTAQALASLGGIGPFAKGGIASSLRQSTGLDLVNIDLDPETGASALTVGKYLAEGLFVSATQDVKGQNGAVNVEYELTDNITVESNIRQDGDQTVSANWKKDF